MKFPITCRINLTTDLEPDHLKAILDPENTTPDETKISTTITEKHKVETIIQGNMTVGTLLRSIDDIIQTTILGEEVAGTTNLDDKQDQKQ